MSGKKGSALKYVVDIEVEPTALNDLSYVKKHGISEDDITEEVAGAVSGIDLFGGADVTARLR